MSRCAAAKRAPGLTSLVFGALVLPLLAWGLAGCAPHKRTNPDYCDPDAGIDNCRARGKVCEQQSYRCVSVVGGSDGGSDAGSDGASDGGTDGASDGASDGGTDSGPDAAPDLRTDGAAPDGATADVAPDGAGDGTAPDKVPPCPTCSGSTPICDTQSGTCRRCASGGECAPATPLCASSGACVLCNGDDDCKASPPGKPLHCLDGLKCVACRDRDDCPDATPVCDSNHACVGCKENNDCAGHTSVPVCRKDDGACVACVDHKDCKSPAKPACVGNVCAPCTSDKQCMDKLGADPGVCMLHTDGHCATEAEVLYVRPIAGCLDNGTGPGAGTVRTPFCQLDRAMPAVSPERSIVVVRPSDGLIALLAWTYSAPPAVAELTVIGQQGATIGPGTDVGVTLTAGTVYLRGLRIFGMLHGGIYVAPGTTLKMNRCIVTDSRGGLFVNGAGFQITNSVFANNDLATIVSPGGTAIEYGGAYLGGLANKLAVFRFNTVYGNKGPGLVCGGAYPVKGLLVAGNTTPQVVTCDFNDGTSEVPGSASVYDPKFDTTDTRNPYRLTAQSSCVNKAGSMASDSPADDIDGNPRPAPPMTPLDCGASEYQAR
ncbi:MAG: right-handed parallel beta-helix repeat-containing protein [Myxococcales bacterium]